jgi:hypothetical protein
MINLWNIRDAAVTTKGWTNFAGTACTLLSAGLSLLVLIFLYRYFEILYGVFYEWEELKRPRIYLICHAIAKLLLINATGIHLFLDEESVTGPQLVAFRGVFDFIGGFFMTFGLFAIIVFYVLLYLASLVCAILFFLSLRKIYPYLSIANLKGANENV